MTHSSPWARVDPASDASPAADLPGAPASYVDPYADPYAVPPTAEAPRRRRGRAAIAALAAVGVLAAAAGGLALGLPEPVTGEVVVAAPSEGPGADPAAQTEIDAAVVRLSDFVEDERGLRFRSPVKVTLLDDEAFAERLRADGTDGDPDTDEAEETAELEGTEATLVALGLVEPGIDLPALIEDGAFADLVLGFYDPEAEELFVRGARLTPGTEAVLVHELTHALQDQHFDLDGLQDAVTEDDDEASLALSALIEGDANWVEQRYLDTLSDEDREQAQQENSAGGDAPDLPPVLLEGLAFPYVAGPEFVDALRDAGGQEAVDEAFGEPPLSAEHILDPESYLAGDDPADLAEPSADGEVVDTGTVGVFDLYLLLSEALGSEEVFQVADGWAAGRYVTWRDGDQACVRLRLAFDTSADADELADALSEYGDVRADDLEVVVEDIADEQVTATSCRR